MTPGPILLLDQLRRVLPYSMEEAYNLDLIPTTCKFDITFYADMGVVYLEIYDTATGTHYKEHLCYLHETEFRRISLAMHSRVLSIAKDVEPYKSIRAHFEEFDNSEIYAKQDVITPIFNTTTRLKVMVKKDEDVYSR